MNSKTITVKEYAELAEQPVATHTSEYGDVHTIYSVERVMGMPNLYRVDFGKDYSYFNMNFTGHTLLDIVQSEVVDETPVKPVIPCPTTARPNALATTEQLASIARKISTFCQGHRYDWFYTFTRDVLGKSVAMNRLTRSQAAQIDTALIDIRAQFVVLGVYSKAQVALYQHYSVLYPGDSHRAESESAACEGKFVGQVTHGRTNRAKYMTRAEAAAYSEMVQAMVERETNATTANGNFELFTAIMEFTKFCEAHDFDADIKLSDMVMQASEGSSRGYAASWQALTEFEGVRLIRHMQDFIKGWQAIE